MLGLDQPPRHRLRDEIGRAHVQPHHEIEVLDLHIDKRRRPVGAGIVDEDVERFRAGDYLFHRLHVAYIERERVSLLLARADGAGGLLDILRCAGGQRDMRAGVRQRRGGG